MMNKNAGCVTTKEINDKNTEYKSCRQFHKLRVVQKNKFYC